MIKEMSAKKGKVLGSRKVTMEEQTEMKEWGREKRTLNIISYKT